MIRSSYKKEVGWAGALGGAFSGLILLAVFIVFIALIMMFKAYVFTQLWGWFIVPVFALPALNYIQAIGVSLVLTFYLVNKDYSDYKNNQFWGWLGGHIGGILLVWFIGWIVQMFL